LLVVEDDTTAQTALKNAVQDPSFDGIQEDFVSDNRLSATEAHDRGRAWLDLRKDVHVAVHGAVRDLQMRSGKTITVTLPEFGMSSTTFLVQHVTEQGFHPVLSPTFEFDATSVTFTFEDWLRLVKRETE